MDDISFCPICNGHFEAGGDSTCTCGDGENYDEDRADEMRNEDE